MTPRKPSLSEEAAYVSRLAQEVASSCGFDFIPPIHLRCGGGGDWNPMTGCVRIGRRELAGDDNHLWYIVAHELAHAQAKRREGHSRSFWVRLANGLQHAGRLILLRYGYGYRETVIGVAKEYGLPDVPKRKEFKLAVGTFANDAEDRKWMIGRRFRRGGAPYYRLKTRGWRWVISEEELLNRMSGFHQEKR